MRGIHFDPDAPVINEQFAVVYAPRRSRGRVPENSVRVVESEQAAREGADPDRKYFAARVVGPSRSSEGMRIYYILEWLA
ncbi:MAG TPA: hypothetical protein EYP40_00925 [Chromatiales bacterium]|nr:hypothetical protein [Chromatiales bacterium]